MNEFETILIDHDQATQKVVIRLNRPEVRNAMNLLMMEELTACFEQFKEDKNIRLIELKGEGKCFCSGADLNWMKSGGSMSEDDSYRDSQKLSHLLQTIESTPQPVVANVHGAAMGGGLGIVACCDDVIAHEATKFRLPEVRIGLIPAMISPFIFSKLSYSDALSLTLSARMFTAVEAKSMGLIHRTYSDSLDRDPFKEYLETAPQASKVAKAFIKKHFKPSQNDTLHQDCIQEISKLRKQPEAQEGIRAILDKTPPPWSSP